MELLHGGVCITSINPENHRKAAADGVHVHDWFRFEYGLDKADRGEQDRSWVEAGRRVQQDLGGGMVRSRSWPPGQSLGTANVLRKSYGSKSSSKRHRVRF
jgi:hypothetical protein